MQNFLQGTHFGYIDVSNLKFYSIIEIWTTSAYGVLLTNSICKTEKKSKEKKSFNSISRWKCS
jgi:hypothetical protein